MRHGTKQFFLWDPLFFVPPPPLGGVTPEKKYPTRYQNFFLPPPLFGAWYGPSSPRNASDFVPLGEKQSVSRAEIRGVLHAVRSRRWEERMVVVLDSEYVFKGITQWSSKWQRHQWRV